ncbi:MAG: hypothetical protein M3075_12695 [Candidatus Dormibacteraeota bacterium]|jgi:hypothetical protein|nr:hypothetical protein [Candidatus Dormibacteraeota bacterium]
MRPPDGAPGSNDSEWAHLIDAELSSWDPGFLSTRFHPRNRQRALPVLRPLPLTLVALLVAVVTAAVLAGGPRALTVVIVNLANGRPQPPPAHEVP